MEIWRGLWWYIVLDASITNNLGLSSLHHRVVNPLYPISLVNRSIGEGHDVGTKKLSEKMAEIVVENNSNS